ncbi:hypothetical protein [Mycetocola zhadangensis]|nr:hypothetical protein [Mycetocola zhadangensis]
MTIEPHGIVPPPRPVRGHIRRKLGIPLAMAVAGVALFSACVSAPEPGVDPTADTKSTVETPQSTWPADPDFAEPDALAPDVAMTCAGLSVIATTLKDAWDRHQSGEITAEQQAAIVNSTIVSFESLANFTFGQRGLKTEIDELLGFVRAQAPLPSGALFDPWSSQPGFDLVWNPLYDACRNNGSEIVTMDAP